MIRTIPFVAHWAAGRFNHRIGKTPDVSGCFPYFRMGNDCSIDRKNIFVVNKHELPKELFHVLAQKMPHGSHVIKSGNSAIYLGVRIHKSPALTKRNDFFH